MVNRSPRHLFHKLFITYSLVLILVVGVLIGYFVSSSRRRVLETNQDYAGKLCGEAVLRVNRASSDADYLHRALYSGNQELDDVLNYLRYAPEEYLERHLDAYAASNILDNKDMFSYAENAFNMYTDIQQIELISYINDNYITFYGENDVHTGDSAGERRQEILNKGLAKPGAVSFQKEIRDTQTMNVEGCVVFTFGVDELAELQKQYPVAEVFLYHKTGTQVYPGDGAMSLEDFQQDGADRKLKSYVQVQGEGDYVVVTSMEKKKAAAIPAASFLTILVIGVLLVIFGETLINRYLKSLAQRLDGILIGMDQVQTGNLQVTLPADADGDELDMISEHFNRMCRELESYIQKSYLAEIEQKNAEMQALQSQINPHFLYNTLEAIRMKAICNGDREVGKMLYSLAVTFRSQLKEDDVITLMQEMHYCKKYLELFEYRYQGKFTSSVECPPELGKIPVIKFIIQPMIENYFIHGIRMEEDNNSIHIYPERRGNDLYIHVEDNGKGMAEEERIKKNEELEKGFMDRHGSIGVSNVNSRLMAAYGKDYGVELGRSISGGMHVILKIKIEEGDTDEKSNAGGR